MTYGVFSQPVGSQSETLHFLNTTVRESLVELGKLVSFEAFGAVPAAVIGRVLEIIEDLIAEECISKEVRINDKFYYVRILTEEEMLTMAKVSA